MRFDIKHEPRNYLIIPIIAIAALVLFSLSPLRYLMFPIPLGFLMMAGLKMYSLFARSTDTHVYVDDFAMTVQYPLLQRRVELSAMTDLSFEDYTVRRSQGRHSHYTEYRVALTIYKNDGKKLILTDIATRTERARSLLSYASRERIPNEATELYRLYRYLTLVRS